MQLDIQLTNLVRIPPLEVIAHLRLTCHAVGLILLSSHPQLQGLASETPAPSARHFKRFQRITTLAQHKSLYPRHLPHRIGLYLECNESNKQTEFSTWMNTSCALCAPSVPSAPRVCRLLRQYAEDAVAEHGVAEYTVAECTKRQSTRR